MKWCILFIAITFIHKEAFGKKVKTSSRSSRSLPTNKNIYKLDHFIELVEKIERHPLIPEKTSLKVIANYIRSFGYDNQKWNKLLGKSEALPDGILTIDEKRILQGMLDHGFSGQQEHGIVNTPQGDVAMGRVITGICAGLNRNKDLVLQEIYGLSSKHMDNLYAATIAGDIAETGMLNKVKPTKPPLFGPGGTWSPNAECPEVFTSLTAVHSAATDAEILGGVDGFLMGLRIQEWWSVAGVRLGQLLRMYYERDGVGYDKNYAACRRFSMFKKMAGKRELIDQTMLSMYAVKNAWNAGVDFSVVQTSTIPKLAQTTTEHFFTYLENLKSEGAVCPKSSDKECEMPANLVFVMDESGSISSNNYEIEKDFVKNITDEFDILPYQTRVAVIEYSTLVHVSLKLNEYASKSRLKCAVDGLKYTGGSTHTSKAIRVAYNILQKAQQSKEYKNYPQIIVLLTDGKSTGGEALLKPLVKSVKDNITNIAIVSVGIGNYDRSELELIATDPIKHVLTAKDFGKLVTLIKSLLGRTCKVPVILKPITVAAQEEEGKDKTKAEVAGYVSPGKARFFTLPAETLFKTENISIEIKPKYGTVTLYVSRTNESPGPDNYDFKLEVGDASMSAGDASITRKRRSLTPQGNQRRLELFNLCKGYNKTNCPPVYIAVVGKNSSQTCSDLDCSVTSQIKFEIKTEQIIPKKENLCYFELEAAKLYAAKDVSVKISAINNTISYYISRTPENPDSSYNDSYRVQHVVAGQMKIISIPTPCRGYEEASCPSVYFFFRGAQLMCKCTGRNCTLPSQVDIKVNFEVKDKSKDKVKKNIEPKVCYHRLGAQRLYGHRMVEVKVSPVKDTITLYASRVNKYPVKENHTQKIESIAVGQTTSLNISRPCKGFDRSKCPSLYLTFIGHQLSCNCTGEVGKERCTLPEQVSIIFTKDPPSSAFTLQDSVCLIAITFIFSLLFK